MMKVIECNNYNREFPELFTWGHIDSIKLSNLANTIVSYIEHDRTTIDRNLTPGLRTALNLIADIAEI